MCVYVIQIYFCRTTLLCQNRVRAVSDKDMVLLNGNLTAFTMQHADHFSHLDRHTIQNVLLDDKINITDKTVMSSGRYR